MPAIDELKAKVQAEIDRCGEDIVRVAQTILQHPEPGFREHKTAQLVAQKFQEFGIPYEDGIALTGLKGILDTGQPGPTVGVMGELDSLIVLGHPHADPQTQAAHACGHHCQIGMMLGVASGLKAASSSSGAHHVGIRLQAALSSPPRAAPAAPAACPQPPVLAMPGSAGRRPPASAPGSTGWRGRAAGRRRRARGRGARQ